MRGTPVFVQERKEAWRINDAVVEMGAASVTLLERLMRKRLIGLKCPSEPFSKL